MKRWNTIKSYLTKTMQWFAKHVRFNVTKSKKNHFWGDVSVSYNTFEHFNMWKWPLPSSTTASVLQGHFHTWFWALLEHYEKLLEISGQSSKRCPDFLVILTYLAGPITIFYAIKAVYFVLHRTARLAGSLLSNCAKPLDNRSSKNNQKLLWNYWNRNFWTRCYSKHFSVRLL